MFENCSEIQRFTHWFLDDEVDAQTAGDIEAHLKLCTLCTLYLSEQAKLRQLLKRTSEQTFMPLSLHQRIQTTLRGERPKTSWQRLWPVAAAIVILMTMVWSHSTRSLRSLEQAAMRHAHDLPMDVQAADLGVVQNYFSQKLPFRVQWPSFEIEPTQKVGGRIIQFDNHDAAYVRFDLPRGRLSMFVYQEGNADSQSLEPSVALHHINGFTTAEWRQNGLVYAIVTDLSEPELKLFLQRFVFKT